MTFDIFSRKLGVLPGNLLLYSQRVLLKVQDLYLFIQKVAHPQNMRKRSHQYEPISTHVSIRFVLKMSSRFAIEVGVRTTYLLFYPAKTMPGKSGFSAFALLRETP